MSPPSTTFAVVVLVVLLLPGLVYAVVRTTLKGFRADDKSIDTRIAQALVFSIVLDALYLLFAFPYVGTLVKVSERSIEVVNAVGLGITILGGAVLLPGLIAFIANSPWRPRKRAKDQLGRRFWIERKTRYSSVPTAWDYAAVLATPRFIRILLPDGRYVGGWWGPESYVSTYPEPRDIFISYPYEMAENGEFGDRKLESDGIWLTVPDGAIVEWVIRRDISNHDNDNDNDNDNEGKQND
jgi:hypothetical protein